MNTAATDETALAAWNPIVLRQEIMSHGLLAAMAWIGGIGYFGVIQILMAEVVLVNLLAAAIFRERPLGRHIGGLFALLILLAFVLLFLIATYETSLADKSAGVHRFGMDALLGIDRNLTLWGLAHSLVYLTALLLYARTRPEPRREWARLGLVQGAITVMALVCTALLLAFIGPFLVDIARWMVAGLSDDLFLVIILLLVRLAFAISISRMPASRWNRIAANPYADG